MIKGPELTQRVAFGETKWRLLDAISQLVSRPSLVFAGLASRTVTFFILTSSILFFLWHPLFLILLRSVEGERQGDTSHIILIPFASLFFLYLERRKVFNAPHWNPGLGAMVMAAGIIFLWGTGNYVVDTANRVSSLMFSIVIVWWGAFIFCYGITSFLAGSFAILFLLFMVPLPTFLLDGIVALLQRISTEVTDILFSVLGVPVFRQGFVFSLSNFTIHVGEECSGIRSALSLFITSVAAGHFFLRSNWTKLGLVAVVVPLAIIKNAFRIVGLALLANYVDPTFITNSALHRGGGIPLFLVSLVVLFSLVWMLRGLEKRFGYDRQTS